MESFKFLLKKGSTICTTVNGSTVLMEAVSRNRLDFVEYLVQNADKLGLDVRVRDKRGSNALFYAASVGNTAIFHRLFEAGCTAENDSVSRTVFMQAALNGHVDMLRYLAVNADTLGIKLEQTDNDGRNALFYGYVSVRLYRALDITLALTYVRKLVLLSLNFRYGFLVRSLKTSGTRT